MRRVIALIVVLGAIFSAMFIYPADPDALANHCAEVRYTI